MEDAMDAQSVGGVPAADWYPDPCGRHESRYWDGVAWTDNVADQGQASIDPVDPAAAAEPVLVTLTRVSDPSWGGSHTVYLTDRRFVVEQVLSVGAGMGAVAAGGLVGATIAMNAAEKKQARMGGQARSMDDVLRTANKAYAIDYAAISSIVLTKKTLPVGYSRFKIASSQKNVTLAFQRTSFDEVAAALTGLLPGRVTAK
jgi:hypothetical protein